MGGEMVDLVRAAFQNEGELLAFAARHRDLSFEVIDGQVVVMSPTGVIHNVIAGNGYLMLRAAAQQARAGAVFGDDLIFVLHQDAASGVRLTCVPDVSFTRKGRLPPGFDFARPFPGAPDLAIEVVSPGDAAEEIDAKVQAYLAHGTAQVWVFYPRSQTVHQHVRGVPDIRVYSVGDTISAEALFPGAVFAVADFFDLSMLHEAD
jgi:Uma2 family endonuclease